MRVPYELARGRIALAELALENGRAEEATRELGHARSALRDLAAPGELERADAMLARAHRDSPALHSAPESAMPRAHGSGPIAP